MARLATFKTESEESFEILRWLDRMLIRLCSKFGEYKKDEAASFRLNMRMSVYPQFMFHLRRSNFLQVFNSSPDETAWFRSILMRADVTDSLCMMQPTLMSYAIDQEPQPGTQILSSHIMPYSHESIHRSRPTNRAIGWQPFSTSAASSRTRF